jgi:hypothetical protein
VAGSRGGNVCGTSVLNDIHLVWCAAAQADVDAGASTAESTESAS